MLRKPMEFLGRDITMLVCESRVERMVGLLGRKSLPIGEAMLLERCGSVHTVGMRFAIDVFFVDDDFKVVKACRNVKPWRMAFGGRKARHTIEAAAGAISWNGDAK